MAAKGLRRAAELVDEERSRAELRGDEQQAMRLGVLAGRVESEAHYTENVAAGLPVVRRRALPPGCTIGWLLKFCAVTRVNRRLLGVQVPDLPEDVTIGEVMGAAA